MAAAAALSGGARPLREKRLPPNLDVFGWCSWDAFYSAVSASGGPAAPQPLPVLLLSYSSLLRFFTCSFWQAAC